MPIADSIEGRDSEREYVRRYDRGTIGTARRDSTGFLHVPATVTRVGVQMYRRGDGKIRRELRPPDEVLSKRNLNSIARSVVTDEHPPKTGEGGGYVTPKNIDRLGRGHAGDNVTVEGELVNVDLIVKQDSLIKKVESRQQTETSCGYDCWIDHTSGVWRGITGDSEPEPYDVIQRGHINNHIAITKRGRGGPSVRLHLDSDDAIEIDESPTGETMKITLTIDGAGVELEPGAASIIKDAISKRDGLLTKATDDLKTLTTEREELQAKHDTMEEDLKKKTEELELKSDSMDPAELSKLVKGRADLLNNAGVLLDKKEMLKVDSADDTEIMRVAVRKHTGLKLTTDEDDDDYKSDDYVRARFDSLVDARSKDGHKRLATGVVVASQSGGADEGRTALDDRIATAMLNTDSAWKSDQKQGTTRVGKDQN